MSHQMNRRTPETALANQQALSRAGLISESQFRQRIGLNRYSFLSAIHHGRLPKASGKDQFGQPTWAADVVDNVCKMLGK